MNSWGWWVKRASTICEGGPSDIVYWSGRVIELDGGEEEAPLRKSCSWNFCSSWNQAIWSGGGGNWPLFLELKSGWNNSGWGRSPKRDEGWFVHNGGTRVEETPSCEGRIATEGGRKDRRKSGRGGHWSPLSELRFHFDEGEGGEKGPLRHSSLKE